MVNFQREFDLGKLFLGDRIAVSDDNNMFVSTYLRGMDGCIVHMYDLNGVYLNIIPNHSILHRKTVDMVHLSSRRVVKLGY